MGKKIIIHNNKTLILACIGLATILWLVFCGILATYLYYADKIYPRVMVAGVSVGGKTPEQATTVLQNALTPPEKIRLVYKEENYDLPLQEMAFTFEIQKSIDDAFVLGRSGNIKNDITSLTKLFIEPVIISPRLSIDQEKLGLFLSTIASDLTIEAHYPQAKIVGGKITIEKAVAGQELDSDKLKTEITAALATQNYKPIEISLITIDPSLTEVEEENFRTRVEKILGKTIRVTADVKTQPLSDKDIALMLWPKGGYNAQAISEFVEKAEKEINRDPQSAKFVFNEGRVQEFAPSKDGLAIKKLELSNQITQALTTLESTDSKELTVEAAVTKTPPNITNAEVNNLGIKELIGRGTSRFKGSISSRIHNVALATSRINGTLVAPGETFSFNAVLGDVSKLTGYKEAYVIQDGKTVLGDGGGVCQVSTTLFRAILNAGLPIPERRGHSYRVGYYEQDSAPGLDATVYYPTTDFKFKNDTANHILIHALADTKALTVTFELYGTSDGRSATITKPVLSAIVEPAEDLYQDDPTLPAGKIKQVEYRAWGGKSSFSYEVKRGDEVIYKKVFLTNYRPWQAVYLRGTGPAQ